MLKHNDLATRLNKRLYTDTTENQEIDANNQLVTEEIIDVPNVIEETPKNIPRYFYIIDYIEFIINILCFGYAAQMLFSTNWPFIGLVSVGYTINFIFNKTLFLFSS